MGRSGSASSGAHPQHPASVSRNLLDPHGWLSQAQAHSPAAAGACSSNKRVNLIRSRSGSDTLSQTAHRLRAVR
jgi:hypothetical protein